jgi:hypothetical protein
MELSVDGRPVVLDPSAQQDKDGIWVPLTPFCEAVDAQLKQVGESWAVCDETDGDICVLLTGTDQRDADGAAFGRLGAFADPLGLDWRIDGAVLAVSRGRAPTVGLRVGDQPPAINLPDLDSGEPVASPAYIGKPAVFYMWASW